MKEKQLQDEHEDGRGNMLVIFREVAEGLRTLDAEDRHKIIDAILDWYTGGTGEVEGLTPTAALVASMMRDRQLAYVSICHKRSAAGLKSGSRRRLFTNSANKIEQVFEQNATGVRTKSNSDSDSDSNSNSESKSDSKNTQMCVRPTFDEVSDYCRERGGRVDARAWYDYYASNGWRVGRNPMKDWRAAVRTWERNSVGAAKSVLRHCDNYIGATDNQIKEFSNGFAN